MKEIIVLNRDLAPNYTCDKPHIYISVKCPYDPDGWAKLPKNKSRVYTLLLAIILQMPVPCECHKYITACEHQHCNN